MSRNDKQRRKQKPVLSERNWGRQRLHLALSTYTHTHTDMYFGYIFSYIMKRKLMLITFESQLQVISSKLSWHFIGSQLLINLMTQTSHARKLIATLPAFPTESIISFNDCLFHHWSLAVKLNMKLQCDLLFKVAWHLPNGPLLGNCCFFFPPGKNIWFGFHFCVFLFTICLSIFLLIIHH